MKKTLMGIALALAIAGSALADGGQTVGSGGRADGDDRQTLGSGGRTEAPADSGQVAGSGNAIVMRAHERVFLFGDLFFTLLFR